MPASSVFVNGKTTKKPGVYPSADASAIGQGNTPRGDIAVVGAFPELQNDVATTYYSAATLRAASPDNKDFARIAKLAFSPGAGSGGARSHAYRDSECGHQGRQGFADRFRGIREACPRRPDGPEPAYG